MKKLSLRFRSYGSVLCTILFLSGTLLATAQSDVTQPGDALIASSANNPASEGVANAIDNQPTKYLNFDAADGTDVGFIVTPSVGVTRVTGLAMQSANDAPERDPGIVRLEGSNDDTVTGWAEGNWTQITEFTVPAYTDRFQVQSFTFENLLPFKHYRFTVLEVQDVAAANSFQIAEVEFLGTVVPGDVTQPGDPLIASSANNPASEGVANAIDNQPTKYLNFDAADGTDVGFIVTPSLGRTLVTGISMQSANDAPERDPGIVRIEGSNDETATGWAEGNWTQITEFTVPPYTSRFQVQTFLFDNFTPYRHYRFTVLEVQDVAAANSFQIAEVELLGTGAPQDATQPGDPLIASSANNPASEGVANAIDNQPTKYLNFDAADGTDVGFIVTPSIGASTVIGMTLQSANDAPERDPGIVRLEGSNDPEVTGWAEGNWTQISEFTVPPYTSRFQVQEFFFPNATPYLHYRFTVLEVQDVAAANSFQIAEVELLAVTSQVDCTKARFVRQPVDTPVLEGSAATFFVQVNGPWPVQWYRNGERIPGATSLSYTTPPITTENAGDIYNAEIVGCEFSVDVMAQIFTPSPIKSIGLNFEGEGANGAPTPMLMEDIAGIHPQAYWNNLVDAASTTPVALTDSDNAASTITVTWASSGEWGAGTGDRSPTERMLNGLLHAQPNSPGNVTFQNVPDGNHTVIAYLVGIPLQFQDANYWVNGMTDVTNYVRVINADEYNPAPGFFRGTSTDPNNRTLATMVRFDNVQPLFGQIVLGWNTVTAGFDRGAPVNAVQLLLNAPDPGAPPQITQNPQPQVTVEGATVTLSVQATGDDLVYQWRKGGQNIPDGGNISGATTSTLTINGMTLDNVGVYNVAVFNAAGSVISRNASVRISEFDINEDLVAYWPLNETSGTTAANAGGGQPGTVTGTATWTAGLIGNALEFDGSSTYVFVDDYTKASSGLGGSLWVNIDPAIASTLNVPMFIRNAEGLTMNAANPAEQFEFGLFYVDATATMHLTVSITSGPLITRVNDPVEFTLGEWTHVAFSADGAQLRLYKNGELVGVSDYLGNINAPTIPWLSLGVRLVDQGGTLVPDPSLPDFMQGLMDDVALWTRGLSVQEVTKIHEAGLAGNPLTSVILDPPDVVTPGVLSFDIDGGQITVSWTAGTLQTAPAVNGPWTDVAGASPLTEAADQAEKYYRTVVNPE